MEWDIRNDQPIYTQLVQQVTLAILSGTFPCGGRLPPVREMAAEAGVNPNTMQRALAELERTGLVYTQRTAGRFVTEDAAVVDSAKQELAHQQIGAFLHRMERMGYDREQTAQLVRSWEEDASEMAILECKDLTKYYDRALGLDHLSLRLEPGRIVGLLGPNGSGKTTLLKIANGLLTPSSGQLLIDGKAPGPDTRRLVSYLPERTYLSDWMTVVQLLDFFCDFYPDFDREAAEHMLTALEISPTQRIKQMSKGTREKVQLILVMSRRTRLYLLDEPIGGVDPATRDYIIHTILTNFNPDSTLLISTHLIADVERILDDVVFISRGQLVLHQSVDQIRQERGCSVDDLFREVFRYAE